MPLLRLRLAYPELLVDIGGHRRADAGSPTRATPC